MGRPLMQHCGCAAKAAQRACSRRYRSAGGATVVHGLGRHQAQAAMVMLRIVPVQQVPPPLKCVLHAAEALGIARAVLAASIPHLLT